MMINKAKGQMITNVELYLPQHAFSYGKLYVALSRGISMQTNSACNYWTTRLMHGDIHKKYCLQESIRWDLINTKILIHQTGKSIHHM